MGGDKRASGNALHDTWTTESISALLECDKVARQRAVEERKPIGGFLLEEWKKTQYRHIGSNSKNQKDYLQKAAYRYRSAAKKAADRCEPVPPSQPNIVVSSSSSSPIDEAVLSEEKARQLRELTRDLFNKAIKTTVDERSVSTRTRCSPNEEELKVLDGCVLEIIEENPKNTPGEILWVINCAMYAAACAWIQWKGNSLRDSINRWREFKKEDEELLEEVKQLRTEISRIAAEL